MSRWGCPRGLVPCPAACPAAAGGPSAGPGGLPTLGPVSTESGNTRRQQIIDIIRERGLLHLPEPVKLASGEMSRDFIDGKAALARGDDLKLACEAILENVGEVEFDAVGGLTMGADQ